MTEFFSEWGWLFLLAGIYGIMLSTGLYVIWVRPSTGSWLEEFSYENDLAYLAMLREEIEFQAEFQGSIDKLYKDLERLRVNIDNIKEKV